MRELKNTGASSIYVPISCYAISQANHELITDSLNRCSALGFETQGKIFLAHFQPNHESELPKVYNSIGRDFDISQFSTSEFKLKIWLGSNSIRAESNSLAIILELLRQLNLLDRFLLALQSDMKRHLTTDIALDRLKETDITYLDQLIGKIENNLIGLKDSVIEKCPVLTLKPGTGALEFEGEELVASTRNLIELATVPHPQFGPHH